MNKTSEIDLKFWVPGEVQKAKSADGQVKMMFKGIASTPSKDTDGEEIDQKGIIIEYFITDGLVNWDHQTKKNPLAYIGYPTKVNFDQKNNLYVECELFNDSETAKAVYNLGSILKKSKSGRRLGYSIEGKVLERDQLNPKKIKKVLITGLAITPKPKNSLTYADVVKGEISSTFNPSWDYEYELIKGHSGNYIIKGEESDPCWDGYEQVGLKTKNGKKVPNCVKKSSESEDEEDDLNIKVKSLSTQTVQSVIKEDIDKDLKNINKNFDFLKKKNNLKSEISKSETYDLIFTEFTNEVQKANKIFNIITHFNTPNMEHISIEAINKAYELLNLTPEIVEKGGDGEEGIVEKGEGPKDTTPSYQNNFGMYGSENGYSVDMVIGMMSSDVTEKGISKKDYIDKATKKGCNKDIAMKAWDTSIEKGIIVKGNSEEKESKDKDDSDLDDVSDTKKDEVKKSKKKDTVEKGIESTDFSQFLLTQKELLESIVTNQNQLVERLDTIEKSENNIQELSNSVNELLNSSQGRRSVQATDYVKKSIDTDEGGEAPAKNQLSVSRNIRDIAQKSTQKALDLIQKGQNSDAKFFEDFAMQLEAGYANNFLGNREAVNQIEKALDIKLVK